MKKIVMLFFLVPFAALAQKEIKPSLPKADKAFRAGKFDEAKAIIDVTTASDEFMKDKKGLPSKNAAKAWFMKGLIYAGMDTTKVETYKKLVDNPLEIAKAAFDKSYELDKGETPSFVNDATGFLPMMNDQIKGQLAQVYLDRAVQYYSKDKDFKNAFAQIENVVYFLPTDTTQLMNAGVYFGPAAEELDKSLNYIDRYFKAGGKQLDAYIQVIGIYEKKKDAPKTLEAIRKARVAFPKNTDFIKFELNVFLTDKNYPQARKIVKQVIETNPEDKESYYLLGGLNNELGNMDSAKLAYQKAVDLDPEYFDAQLDLAKLYYLDAKKIKAERDKLGITPADIQKRKTLFDALQKQYSIALPYWEKARKIRGDDETVLYHLHEIYTSLVMDDKAEEVRKKMKALGYLD